MTTSEARRIILNRGGYDRPMDGGDAEYEGLIDNVGGYSMGFSVHQVDGTTHGFFFHDVRGIKHYTEKENGGTVEYITFSHIGDTVILRGHNLVRILKSMLSNATDAIHEHDGVQSYNRTKPLIDRVSFRKMNYPNELN